MPKTSVEFFFLPPNQTNQHYTCTGSWLKKGHNTGDLRVTIGNKNVNGIFSPFGLSCFHCINPRPPSANVQPLGRGGGFVQMFHCPVDTRGILLLTALR